MVRITEEQIAMRELREAAYHEIGHKFMCRRFGGDGDAVVWKSFGRSEEKAWFGQFRTRLCPQVMQDAMKQNGLPPIDLPNNWKKLFGLAGAVAEEILRGEADDIDLITDAIVTKIFCYEMSETDLEEMGISDVNDYELIDEDVQQAWRYLKADWDSIQVEAEHLIADALAANGLDVSKGS